MGLNPITEQKLAGHLTEPPVSDPNDAVHSAAATAAALPPDYPPLTNTRLHGFLVWPKFLNYVV